MRAGLAEGRQLGLAKGFEIGAVRQAACMHACMHAAHACCPAQGSH